MYQYYMGWIRKIYWNGALLRSLIRSMKTYIYLLWDHDEDGPCEVVATLDRSKVAGLVSNLCPRGEGRIAEILAHTDEELLTTGSPDRDINGKHFLEFDNWGLLALWGGFTFQIVELS